MGIKMVGYRLEVNKLYCSPWRLKAFLKYFRSQLLS